jgi:hypothetical protein
MSDPRYTDPRLSDPVQRYDGDVSTNGTWGWIAGLAVLFLIIVFLVAGGHNANQASNTGATQSPVTTGAAGPMRNVTPSGTTGMGTTSPPSPTAIPPGPPPSGNQQ